MAWSYLLLGAFVLYGLVNLAFGTVYYFLRDGLRPADLAFSDCFFFSVHTFSTVGYGGTVPVSLAVNGVTVIETFCGLVAMAMLTGLFFAKFSRPSARFLFSKPLLVTKYREKRTLLARVANARVNSVMNAEFRLTLTYDEVTPEGIKFRRLEELPLERSSTPVFTLSMTVAHFIEPGSRGEQMLTCLQKKEKNVEFLLSVRGVDDTLGQEIHDMHLYQQDAIIFDRQFADVLSARDNGVVEIDFAKFHDLR
jgi:inward rectifier potassium channel